MLKNCFIFLLLICIFENTVQNGRIGDLCTLDNSTEKGVCTEITKCIGAIENHITEIHPKICSFETITPIICCSNHTNQLSRIDLRLADNTIPTSDTASNIFYPRSTGRNYAEGDVCTIVNTGEEGTCVLIKKCRGAVEGIRKRIYPNICAFQGITPLVCCSQIIESVQDLKSPVTVIPEDNINTIEPLTAIEPEVSPTGLKSSNRSIVERISEQSKLIVNNFSLHVIFNHEFVSFCWHLSSFIYFIKYLFLECAEYADQVYRNEIPIAMKPNPSLENITLCAHELMPMIVGGDKAAPREFPHMALVGFGNKSSIKWKCGASLISERFVITAGHCLYSTQYGPARWVRIGDLNIVSNDDEADPQEFSIEEIIKHPEYKPPSHYNDIALIKLSRNVTFTAFARPACLQDQHNVTVNKVIATGWGNMNYGGEQSEDLLKVSIDIFDQPSCNFTYRNNISTRKLRFGIISDIQICAGGLNEKKSTCQGDSGGPVQIFNAEFECMYRIVGITSMGKACGVPNAPTIYTRISGYIQWIERIVWPITNKPI